MKRIVTFFLVVSMLFGSNALAVEKVDKNIVSFPETYYAMYADAEVLCATPFSEGLAAVSIEGKIGFINRAGILVIPAVWEKAEPFHNGLSLVKGERGYGFINKKGEVVIAPIWCGFERPSGTQGEPEDYFYNGITWVQDWRGMWGLINSKGKMLLSPQLIRGERSYEWTSPTFGENANSVTTAFDYDTWTFHYINSKGEAAGMYSQLIALGYLNIEEYANGYSKHNVFEKDGELFLADGTYVTQQQVDTDKKLYVDETVAVPDTSVAIGEWSDPIPALPGGNVFLGWKKDIGGRCLIDANGNLLCQDVFDAPGGVHIIDGNHLLAVSQQGNCYRVEANGKIKALKSITIPIMGGLLEHDHVQGLRKDNKPVLGLSEPANYAGYLNNRLLLLADYDNGTYGLVNTQGEVISRPYWDSIEKYEGNTVLVSKNDLYGLLDSRGHTILETKYDKVIGVGQDYALAYKDGMFSFHSVKDGSVLGERRWDYAEPFKSNRAYVGWTANGELQHGFISTQGKIVVTLPQDFSVGDKGYFYSDEMLMCIQDGLYGFLDRGGKMAVKAQWDAATDFDEERAIVWKDAQWYIIDRLGNVIY